jgi:hypothetical protein
MRRLLKQTNEFAREVERELGKNVVAVRVFDNSLLLYFDKGSCEFYSKSGLDWGSVGHIYFVTTNFNVDKLSARLKEQYNTLIQWTKDYVEGNIISRFLLTLQYTTQYAG